MASPAVARVSPQPALPLQAYATLADAPDIALVRMAADGSPDAFNELYERYKVRVLRICRKVLKYQNQHLAQDASQEAWAKAASRISQFRGDSKFGTWLTRVALNEALMILRRNKKWSQRVSLDDPIGVSEGYDVVHDVEAPDAVAPLLKGMDAAKFRADLEESIAELPLSLRTVFILHELEGFSLEETRAALGLSMGAVKARSSRARSSIREALRPALIKSLV